MRTSSTLDAYDRLPVSPGLVTMGSNDHCVGTSCLESPGVSPLRDSFERHGTSEKNINGVTGSAFLLNPPAHRTIFSLFCRRQLRYLVVLLSISAFALFRTFSATESNFSLSSLLTGASSPIQLHPTLVGPRPLTASAGKSLYSTCTADELLLSIKGAVIRPNGASRFPNKTRQESVELEPLVWSFDLPSDRASADGNAAKDCGVPKVYSQAEACEILSAFGGLYIAGDSFGRHVLSALLIILRDRIDGAVRDFATTEDCRGEQAFDDGKLCRNRIPFDTSVEMPVCGGKTALGYLHILAPQVPFPTARVIQSFNSWRGSLSKHSQRLSPVFITAIGSHFDYKASDLFPDYIPSMISYLDRQYPVPLNLYAGPHKPGVNQPLQYRERQGPHKVLAFKEQVERELLQKSIEKKGERGGARYIDFYAMSDGATLFDGTHLGFIPNLEKAHLLLNLLDLWWADIVAAGGLVAALE